MVLPAPRTAGGRPLSTPRILRHSAPIRRHPSRLPVHQFLHNLWTIPPHSVDRCGRRASPRFDAVPGGHQRVCRRAHGAAVPGSSPTFLPATHPGSRSRRFPPVPCEHPSHRPGRHPNPLGDLPRRQPGRPIVTHPVRPELRRRPTHHNTGRAAQTAAFPLRQPTPHPVPLAVLQSPRQAFLPHLTAPADPLSGCGRAVFLREPHVGVDFGAGRGAVEVGALPHGERHAAPPSKVAAAPRNSRKAPTGTRNCRPIW